MYRSRQLAREASHRRSRRAPGPSPLSILFFPAVILYQELLLRLFDRDTAFFGMALLRVALFSLAAGLCLFLILDLLPWRGAARTAGGAAIGVWTVLLCVERGCRSMFGLYFGLALMGSMAGDVVGDFGGAVLKTARDLLPFILLSLAPLAAYIPLRRAIIRERGQGTGTWIILAGGLAACQLFGWVLSAFGGASGYYTYEYTANAGVPHFGLVTAVRLELKYAVWGTPASPDDFIDSPAGTPSAGPTAGTGEPAASAPVWTGEPGAVPVSGPSPRPVPSGPNVLDIDFEALAEGEADETVRGMHRYFASLTPSEKNEYTGMFKGKNLILITAEAFSPYVISKELTPTLYRLSHEGFVFTDYYQPDWGQSTCGGEFANTTGVIPNLIDGRMTVRTAKNNYMPFTLGSRFAALGYRVPAWHNHTYDYYGRDEYLTAFGYEYQGIGSGLEYPGELEAQWPKSDLIMMENTADSYINEYLDNGVPFHAYYMTVSGHAEYSFSGNAMAYKNREAARAAFPGASEAVQAYIACSLELEYALEYLVDKLEAAGIAGDTLIVMTTDHYPYALLTDSRDYYNELRGFEDTELVTSRYRSTLIMWSGCIGEPVVVDTPCSSIDIVPTLCNLFGLDYDSRLYSGRDVFASNYEADRYSNCMPLVVFADNKGQGNSWITAAGVYEASAGTFTPNEGVAVDDGYVARVNRLVAGKINYSRLIVQEDYYRLLFPDGIT